MTLYRCGIKECTAEDRPENGCEFSYGDEEEIELVKNENCIYKASYVKRRLKVID